MIQLLIIREGRKSCYPIMAEDVYKRQIPSSPDVVGYGDIRYEIGLIRCHSESTGTVSYTHLAVYKRRLLHCRNEYQQEG